MMPFALLLLIRGRKLLLIRKQSNQFALLIGFGIRYRALADGRIAVLLRTCRKLKRFLRPLRIPQFYRQIQADLMLAVLIILPSTDCPARICRSRFQNTNRRGLHLRYNRRKMCVRSSQLSGMIYCTVPPIAYACVFLVDPSCASLHNSVYSLSINFIIINKSNY